MLNSSHKSLIFNLLYLFKNVSLKIYIFVFYVEFGGDWQKFLFEFYFPNPADRFQAKQVTFPFNIFTIKKKIKICLCIYIICAYNLKIS